MLGKCCYGNYGNNNNANEERVLGTATLEGIMYRFRRWFKVLTLLLLAIGVWYSFGTITKYPATANTRDDSLSPSIINNTTQHSVVNDKYSKDTWITLSLNVHIFSAYFDNRNNKAKHGEIQIMAFVNETWQGMVHCVFMFTEEETVCSKEQTQKTFLRIKQHYSAIMYTCRLPSPRIPIAVTVAFDAKCTTRNVSFTKVTNEKWSTVKEFGVCIHSPMFNVVDPQFVGEYMEMSLLLGAESFTGYIESASAQVRSLLRGYGPLFEAVEWGTNLPSPNRYKGQDLSIQDCLYRNMHKVKYLVYTDLDELIFPLKHPNWHKMMEALDSGKIGVFYFVHVAMFQNKDDPNSKNIYRKHANCSQRDAIRQLEIPRYLSYTLQTTNGFWKKKKLIIKPVAVRSLRVHNAKITYGNQRIKSASETEAKMYHFRSSPFPGYEKSTVYFNKVQQHVPKILDNLKKRLCNLR